MKYQNLLNYSTGIIFGVIAVYYYTIDTTYYYFILSPVIVIWYFFLNYKKEMRFENETNTIY